MSNNRILDYIAPAFQPYIQDVYQDLNLGLCKSNVSIERIGGLTHKADCQFRLVLPYCSKQLRWEILFDPQSPWLAPDFRFDDDTFISSSEDNLDCELPSLAQWDASDPKSLRKVLMELIQLYKNYQVKKLSEDNTHAHLEYTSLVASTPPHDVQVWAGERGVELLIRLRVNVERLPELYNESLEENPGLDSALLLVRRPYAGGAELRLSPFLAKAIGPVNLPPMHQNGALDDYVARVTDLLNSKVVAVLDNSRLKRSLLAALAVRHEGALLERSHDAVHFLLQRHDLFWVLHVDLATNIPAKPPIITIRSSYYKVKGKPRTKVLTNCPYNNFEAYIMQQVDIFKNECQDTSNTEY